MTSMFLSNTANRIPGQTIASVEWVLRCLGLNLPNHQKFRLQ